MVIPKHIVDDFKTNRKDITPPLPYILRLVPLCFYLSIVAAVVLCSVFLLQIAVATDNIQKDTRATESILAEAKQTDEQRGKLEARIIQATDLQAWAEGSLPVQPLAVSAARSIESGSMLSDLRIDRDSGAPSSIRFGMRVAATSPDQIERTTTALTDQAYRVVQPQRTLSEGQIDFRATLVSPSGRAADSPAPDSP
jgi:hypothetical protein